MNFEEFLESQPESNLLGFLLVAPARSFSVFEISKRLGMQELAVLSHAASLQKSGYIKRFSKNGTTYLILNQSHALFPEIRNTLLKANRSYEDELFTAIKKLNGLEATFLSGLFTGNPNLPVDILLVGKVFPVSLEVFLDACQSMMRQEINYSIMSAQEFRERRDTFDKFIKDIFDYPYLTVFNKIKK